jgi:dolichyl-phosphate-mannose-protein mannosyltransferase
MTSLDRPNATPTTARPAVRTRRRATRPRLARVLTRPWVRLALLLLVALLLRGVWLTKPNNSLIFDEYYYVNAARHILGWRVPSNDPYISRPTGIDPNSEHPPLAKLLIAGSMRIFGDNGVGWRLPSVLLGTFSILLVYGIVRRVEAREHVAFLAAFLYAFDNLVFVHSRIATLDIFFVTFMLLGIFLYLSNQVEFAALALVVSTLCKIAGVYGIAVLIAYEALKIVRARIESGRWSFGVVRRLAALVGIYIVFLPVELGLLDHWWGAYHNPFSHLRHIWTYGLALTRAGGPQGQESNPWQWLVNEVPMTYFESSVQVLVGGKVNITRPIVFFRGAMNPYVIFMAPLGIAYAISRAFTRRGNFSFLILALFFCTYLPWWVAAIFGNRISYIFYFLPVVPAVAMAAALFMEAPEMPKIVRWAYVAAVLLAFYEYFPFRQIP